MSKPPNKRPEFNDYYVHSKWVMLMLHDTHVTREQLLSVLQDRLPYIKTILVVREPHQNGSHHLHAYVEFTQRHQLSVNRLEKLTGMRFYIGYCLPGVVDYLLKEDKQFIVHPDHRHSDLKERQQILQAVKPSSSALMRHNKEKASDGVSVQVAKAISKGATDFELAQTFPGFHLMNGTRIANFRSIYQRGVQKIQQEQSYLVWTPIPVEQFLKPHDQIIGHWLNYVMEMHRLRRSGQPVQFDRDCHLWLHGKTKTGKSRLLHVLRKFGPVFDLHYNAAGWQDHFEQEKYNFIYAEEFKDDEKVIGMHVSQLNSWLDGTNLVNQRYKTPMAREGIVPWIAVSNKDPGEMFKEEDPDTRNALFTRFVYVQIPEGEEITVLSYLWDTNRLSFRDYVAYAGIDTTLKPIAPTQPPVASPVASSNDDENFDELFQLVNNDSNHSFSFDL